MRKRLEGGNAVGAARQRRVRGFGSGVLGLALAIAAAAPAAEWSQLAGPPPSAVRRGVAPQPRDQMNEETRREIRDVLGRAAAARRARGEVAAGGPPVLFGWPLAPAAHLQGFDFHATSHFVDHDTDFPGHLLDYDCGYRTYDRESGYNHPGTDIILWPFAWNRVETGAVHVVAIADGIIIHRYDGQPDRNCGNARDPWNAVYVEHVDGSTAIYGHLKRYSLTEKQIGDSVVRGEYLGAVGSSGASTYPHLHLEIYDPPIDIRIVTLDPYAGPCNGTVAASRWRYQPPYHDRAINEITSGTAEPILPSCDQETSNHQDVVLLGAPLVLTSYYRDELPGDVSRHSIYRGDRTIYARWSHTNPHPHTHASYWSWRFDEFGEGESPGSWRYEIEYAGATYVHRFFVVDHPDDVPTATPALPFCIGDCNGDGFTTITELLRAVRIALGDGAIEECAAADATADGRLKVGELVQCVDTALYRCPSE